MSGISAPIRGLKACSQLSALCSAGAFAHRNGSSPDTRSAGTLTLDSTLQNCKNKCPLFKRQWMAARTDRVPVMPRCVK